jgi:hypothetical protein
MKKNLEILRLFANDEEKELTFQERLKGMEEKTQDMLR